MAAFVLLHAVDERSVSLSIVGRAVVQAEDLVDGGGEFRRRGSLRLCEEVTKVSGGGVCQSHLICLRSKKSPTFQKESYVPKRVLDT